MKRFAIAASAGLLLLWSGNALAADMMASIEVLRSLAETERKAVVASNMSFTPEEAEAFWPVYNEYREEMRKVGDARVKLIRDLAESFETLDDAGAEQLTKAWLDYQDDRLKVRKSFLKKFNKAVSPKNTLRFVQIDNKLDVIIEFKLAEEIPLVN